MVNDLGVEGYQSTGDGSDFDENWTEAIAKASGRITDLGLYPASPADFTIFKVGSTYYRRNGQTGEDDDSNADACALANAIWNAGDYHVHFLSGTFTGGNGLDMGGSVGRLSGSGIGATIIEITSTTDDILHATGRGSLIENLTLKGSGRANTNVGIYIDGDETDACSNSSFRDIWIRDIETGILLEDNSWNNHFQRVYIDNVKTGLKAQRNTLAAPSWNGENFICRDVWVADDGAVYPEYGFDIDKANAFFIETCQVLSPEYDGIKISAFGEGLSVVSNSQFDVCGRFGLNITLASQGGWFESNESFYKGGATDALVGGLRGCGAYIENLTKGALLGGEIETVTTAPTVAHQVLRLVTCETLRIIDQRLYSGEDALNTSVTLESSNYVTLIGNYIQGGLNGIVESGTSDYNFVISNRPSIGAGAEYTITGNNTVIIGYQAGTPTLLIGADGAGTSSKTVQTKASFAIGGTDLTMGGASLRALVYDSGATSLIMNFGADFASGVDIQSIVNTNQHYRVDGTQVLKEQQAAIADIGGGGADSDGTCRNKVDAILAMLRAHGIIAT